MKRMMLILAGVSALAAAAPAAAQYSRYDNGSVETRTNELRQRIDDDMRRGLVTRTDGYRLMRQASDLARLQAQYRANGYSSWERSDLDRRFDSLAGQVASAERMRSGNGYGYGYDRGYDRGYGGTYSPYDDRSGYGTTYDPYHDWSYGSGDTYDPYASTDPYSYDRYDYDRNNDGYDDRDRDRDGRTDDDVYGYDNGAYGDQDYGSYGDQTYDNAPSGYATAPAYDNGPSGYGTAPAYDNGPGSYAGGALKVGDRAPVNLAPVPPEFRSLYADGNGVYYRYEDGRVYQIDRATNEIRWIGQIPY